MYSLYITCTKFSELFSLFPGSYLSRQVGRWTKQYVASETHTIPAMDRLSHWLNSTPLPPGRTTVVHGDFRYILLCIVCVYNCCNTDTNGFSEVSLFQRLKCMQEWYIQYLTWEKARELSSVYVAFFTHHASFTFLLDLYLFMFYLCKSLLNFL